MNTDKHGLEKTRNLKFAICNIQFSIPSLSLYRQTLVWLCDRSTPNRKLQIKVPSPYLSLLGSS